MSVQESPEATVEVDARGTYCPGPMMEMIRMIRDAKVGDVVAVLSTDSGSRRDIPKWCEKSGQEFIAVTRVDNYDRIVVKKVH